jgi:hypothetical protein
MNNPERYRSFFGAMRIDASDPLMNLKNTWINGSGVFASAKTVEDQPKVIIPGDPEREMENLRMNNGIHY